MPDAGREAGDRGDKEENVWPHGVINLKPRLFNPKPVCVVTGLKSLTMCQMFHKVCEVLDQYMPDIDICKGNM